MKTFKYYFLIFVLLVVTACTHNVHDLDGDGAVLPGSYKDYQGALGFLTAQLSWEDPTDIKTQVNNIHTIIFGSSGYVVEDASFSALEDVADWIEKLPVGEYDVLITVNMSEDDGYWQRNNVVSLVDPSSSPKQAWYAMAHASIKENEMTLAEFVLQRLLASLTITIINVPEEVSIDFIVNHMASSVNLTAKNGSGRYGLPSSVPLSVPMRQPTPMRSVTLTVAAQTLLPTATNYDRTFIDMNVTDQFGTGTYYLSDTPRMDSGKSYILNLDYTELRSYMYFDTVVINDWMEGWVIGGEIVNPD